MAVRPYRSNDHLWSVAASKAGRVAILPLRADSLHFEVAWSNSYPANGPEGEHGSTVLDIGHGVKVRASGNATRADGVWTVPASYVSAMQYPSGRDLTAAQWKRLREAIADMLNEWAAPREADIAQADDIYRNNAARTLEESIARHEAALEILRVNVAACNEGEPFETYPDVPTAR